MTNVSVGSQQDDHIKTWSKACWYRWSWSHRMGQRINCDWAWEDWKNKRIFE